MAVSEDARSAEDASPPVTAGASTRMQCMQVWGGSRAIDTSVSTTGLDVWLYCKPYGSRTEGGDVYYLSSCSSGRITRLALADVRGHGDSVLALARGLRRLMQRHIDHIDQNTLVNEVNREFTAAGDEGTFATALIATFFLPTSTLSLSNAGHPAPLRFDAGPGAWRPVEWDSPSGELADVPLGLFASARYAQVRVKMSTRDLLLCYTDGLEECVDEQGEMLGRTGLARLIAETNSREPGTIIPQILRRVASMSPENLSGDDVTLLLIRPNGASVPWRDNVLAPFRYLANLAGAGT